MQAASAAPSYQCWSKKGNHITLLSCPIRTAFSCHLFLSAKVYIADRDVTGANAFADELNTFSNSKVAFAAQVDVTSWDQQVAAWDKAVKEFGRVDYVFPIAGINERAWIPNDPSSKSWAKPELGVLDADVNGVLYTVALAVQQFRRQEPQHGFRGKSEFV